MLAIENPCRREDAERFIAHVRGDDASYLRIEEHAFGAGSVD
jgi:hypothetical protein